MSVSEFWQANLAETFRYIYSRAEFYKNQSENAWMVMRWQSTLMLNMMSSKGKSYKPTDLFTFDSEEKQKMPKVDVNSQEANEMFEKMQKVIAEKYKEK